MSIPAPWKFTTSNSITCFSLDILLYFMKLKFMAQRGKIDAMHIASGYATMRVSGFRKTLSPIFILPSLKQDSQASILH
jgi:hypothetical protein